MLMIFKAYKANSVDELVGMAFLYLKIGSSILFFFANSRLSVPYLITCLIIFLFLRQPTYSGPSNLLRVGSKESIFQILGVKSETDLILGSKAYDYLKKEKSLKKKKTNETKKEKDFSKMKQTLLIFNAPWSQTCVFTYSIWVTFANRFSTDNFKFVEVNTRRLEEVCHIFKVNPQDGNQLPTLVLLEDNKEVLRFPPIDYEKGTLSKVLSYKEKELVRYFDLDRRFMAT
jgi:hypothetical protein